MKTHHLTTPLTKETLATLNAGDNVFLSGTVYTARDAAHLRMTQALCENQQLPVDLRGEVIFYAGPTPAPPGKPIGSIGPTTSGRMDPYTEAMLAYGTLAFIGKGERNDDVKKALKKYGGVYFAAIGGCAAHMAACITQSEEVAYLDLGPESIKKLTVVNLPIICAVDSRGVDAYAQGVSDYLRQC